jgi:hypothetical protein
MTLKFRCNEGSLWRMSQIGEATNRNSKDAAESERTKRINITAPA